MRARDRGGRGVRAHRIALARQEAKGTEPGADELTTRDEGIR